MIAKLANTIKNFFGLKEKYEKYVIGCEYEDYEGYTFVREQSEEDRETREIRDQINEMITRCESLETSATLTERARHDIIEDEKTENILFPVEETNDQQSAIDELPEYGETLNRCDHCGYEFYIGMPRDMYEQVKNDTGIKHKCALGYTGTIRTISWRKI